MANIVNFTDKQFENRLNDNLEELVQGKKAVESIAFFYLITYLLKKVYRQVLNYTKMLLVLSF